MDDGRSTPRLRVGRYVIHGEIASGGMATVHYGRLLGPAGFSRTVAVKRLHVHYARDPEFVEMFLDEARLAARIHHPNVVATLDVLAEGGELFLVMELVHGLSLSRLARLARERGERIPIDVACAIVCDALHGLHAAHDATSEKGEPLEIVHRDVSPQNILVGSDGIARVLDFGVAKAVARLHETRDGQVKGKVSYMAPEQLAGSVDRRTDVYAAGVVLWELLTGERLFEAAGELALVKKIRTAAVEPPGSKAPGIPRALDDVVMRALEREPTRRFGTARRMALALEEAAGGVASRVRVGDWVSDLASDVLERHARAIAEIESSYAEPDEPEPAKPPAAPIDEARGGAKRKTALVAALVVAGVLGVGFAVSRPARPVVDAKPDEGVADVPATAAPSAVAEAPVPSAGPTAAEVAVPSATTKARSTPHPPVRRPAPARSAACAVRSWLDDAGVKHFYNDCSTPP